MAKAVFQQLNRRLPTKKGQVGDDLPCVSDWNAVPDSAALSSCSFRLDRHKRWTGFRRSRTHRERRSTMLRRCEP